MIARRTLFFFSLCQFQSPAYIALPGANEGWPYLLPLPPPLYHYSNSHCYRVSSCLAPCSRCRSHSSFPSPLLPYTLVPFSWRTFCLAPNALPTFPLHSRTFLHQSRLILLAYFLPRSSFYAAIPSLTVSPQVLLPLFYFLQSRPILLA